MFHPEHTSHNRAYVVPHNELIFVLLQESRNAHYRRRGAKIETVSNGDYVLETTANLTEHYVIHFVVDGNLYMCV